MKFNLLPACDPVCGVTVERPQAAGALPKSLRHVAFLGVACPIGADAWNAVRDLPPALARKTHMQPSYEDGGPSRSGSRRLSRSNPFSTRLSHAADMEDPHPRRPYSCRRHTFLPDALAWSSQCRIFSRSQARLAVFRYGHCLSDCGEFLSLPREDFELLFCIIVGKREEFHRRLHAH
jgi:hypothetical protein